jgi:hypothetical protein
MGGSGGTGGARTFAKPEGSVPSQYAGTPTNKGQWTSTTYPAFYHGSGSVGQVIAKQSSSITKPVNIYTPPGYDAQNKYPLVFFLHGYPDNQDTWRQRAKIKPDVLLDNLINAKVIKPIIGVWPMGSSTGNSNDTGGYMVFDNELFGDLIPFLESKYSIAAGRDSRGMSGFSYGGMQTINVFLCHHLKDFGWFAGYSPAGGNYGSDMIASCLKQQDPKTYPVNYFYIQTGSNELATSSAAASANGLTTKAAPASAAASNCSTSSTVPAPTVKVPSTSAAIARIASSAAGVRSVTSAQWIPPRRRAAASCGATEASSSTTTGITGCASTNDRAIGDVIARASRHRRAERCR